MPTQSPALKLGCGCICAETELVAREARTGHLCVSRPGDTGGEPSVAHFPGVLLGVLALWEPPPHLVGCNLLKRSLITGVPLNIRPRYKDFMLLATLKGTQGKMSCRNGSEECQAGPGPGSALLPVTKGLSGCQSSPRPAPTPRPVWAPGTRTGSAGASGLRSG